MKVYFDTVPDTQSAAGAGPVVVDFTVGAESSADEDIVGSVVGFACFEETDQKQLIVKFEARTEPLIGHARGRQFDAGGSAC